MKSVIRHFTGEHAFLSNFYEARVLFDARHWPTAEHAYQAMKTADFGLQEVIRDALTPGEAKRLGRALLRIRDGWDRYKDAYMERIVDAKFQQHPELMEKLLATGEALLIEGNDWGDMYWGMVKRNDGRWVGRNQLGKVLMDVRERARGHKA